MPFWKQEDDGEDLVDFYHQEFMNEVVKLSMESWKKVREEREENRKKEREEFDKIRAERAKKDLEYW